MNPGIAWMVAAVLLLWAGIRFFARYPDAPRTLRALSRHEAAFLAAAADATFPPGGDLPPSGTEAGVVGYLDGYLATMPRRNRLLVRMLFFLFEHATFFLPAPGWDGMRRFSSLRSEQQQAVLEAWGRSRRRFRRVVFTSLRTLLTMGYMSSPVVLRAIGLAPLAIETPVVEADLLYPRVGERRSGVRRDPGDRDAPDGAPLDPRGPLHPAYREAGS